MAINVSSQYIKIITDEKSEISPTDRDHTRQDSTASDLCKDFEIFCSLFSRSTFISGQKSHISGRRYVTDTLKLHHVTWLVSISK